jgi:hypothetical protein
MGRCGEWYRVDGLRLLLTAEGDSSESTSLELRSEVTSYSGYLFDITQLR